MTLIRRSSTAVPIAIVLTLAAGSALAGAVWPHGGWPAVAALGAAFGLLATLLQIGSLVRRNAG